MTNEDLRLVVNSRVALGLALAKSPTASDGISPKSGLHRTPCWREMDSNPRSLERGTTLFKIAPFDHSYNSVLVTEIISARPEVGPIWGVRRRGK